MSAPRLALSALLILCLGTSVATSFAAPDDDLPSPDAKSAAEIVQLIHDLGNESYASREAATEKLLTYGLPALKLVEAGARDADREIRYRCERVRVMLREIDLQRRLEAFAADVKGEKDHGLPAWNRFAEMHGSGGDARQLFVDIFRAEPELLKTMQIDVKKVGDLVSGRVFQLQALLQAQQPISLGSIAGMLFAATDKDVVLSDQAQQMVFSLCYQQSLRDAVTTANGKQIVVRSLLGKYMVRAEGNLAWQALNIGMQYDMKEALEPARKLVKSKGAGNPHLMQMGLLAIAKLGGNEDLKDMEEMLEDKQVITNFTINNQQIQCQVRDIALLSTLHLLAKDKERVKGTALESGDLKAFGFERLEANPQQLYAPHTVGFPSDDKRQEVFKKWTAVKAKLAEKKPEEKK